MGVEKLGEIATSSKLVGRRVGLAGRPGVGRGDLEPEGPSLHFTRPFTLVGPTIRAQTATAGDLCRRLQPSSSKRWDSHEATRLCEWRLRKLARPRDGVSCSLRCAVMPTLCSGAAPPVVVTPAPTVGWDGHVDAISSGSCGRRCPLSPSCPTPSATGAVALIALLCACADGGARDGRAAAAWPRGQKLRDAGGA